MAQAWRFCYNGAGSFINRMAMCVFFIFGICQTNLQTRKIAKRRARKDGTLTVYRKLDWNLIHQSYIVLNFVLSR